MKKKRIVTMDLLKFLFALVIVLFHSKNITTGDETALFTRGSMAVEFFFIVSGFFFAKAIERAVPEHIGTDTLKFIGHRISGYLPDYYVAWVIAFIVEYTWSLHKYSLFTYLLHSVPELLFIESTGIGSVAFVSNNVTWYISAMLLAMFILYPIAIKNKDLFFKVIAPLIVLLIYGYMFRELANLSAPNAWLGFVKKGALRAICGISVGCICCKVVEYLNSLNFKKPVRLFFTLADLGVLAYALRHIYSHHAGKADFMMVWLFAAVVILSNIDFISQISFGDTVNRITSWLGEFSFALFLSHGFWSHVINKISYFDGMTYWTKLVYFLAMSCATALFVMYTSKALKKIDIGRIKAMLCESAA